MTTLIVVLILFSVAPVKVSSQCSRPLGMRDGTILDSQITATSAFRGHLPYQARPQDRGWCPLLSDLTPYLQVDFMSTATVEGVQLNTEGSFHTAFEGDNGSFVFEIEIGTNLSELYRLPELFHLNPFLPEDHMETFMFSSSLHLRYLKIYPVNHSAEDLFICLRLEVIGCGIPDPLSIYRECASPRHWFPARNLYAPYPPLGSLSETTADTLSECLGSCENIPKCYSVLYYSDTTECEMYSPSSAYSYKSLSVVGNKTEGYIGICGEDDYLGFHNESLASTMHLSLEDKVPNNPGIIFSSGYPFYYPTGSFTWIISFATGTYGNLLFSNISLNVYTAVKGSTCEDRIQIDTSFYMSRVVLSGSMNNQQYSFKSEDDIITMSFTTCAEINRIEEQGKGFRVLAYASDTPTCYPYCKKNNVDIVSQSFLGGSFDDTIYYEWYLQRYKNDRIILEISDFHVSCETGTVFEVSLSQTFTSHCNKNKPLYPFAAFYIMGVTFELQLNGDQSAIVEGFKGHWMTINRNFRPTDLATTYEEACSEELKKCFNIFNLTEGGDVSWNVFKSQWCEIQNMSMGTIHSKWEQKFISVFLEHMLWMHNFSLLTSAYIGLSRKENKFVWNDDSPVTYTAWSADQPLKVVKSDCVKIGITSESHETSWESIPCDALEANFGVCEYLYLTGNSTSDHMQSGLTPDTFETMPVIEPYKYYHCGDGEIISILGKCDGRRDCVSGTDEENCDASRSCTMDKYRCNDGACIDLSLRCDFYPDCVDGADEDCDFAACSTLDFECGSKVCIDGSLRCDGKPDCLSGEDELQCATCNSSTSFMCEDNGDFKCISLMYKCDGIPDCRSGEDEQNCEKPDTCQGWWNAGYRTNGIYGIGDDTIECDFSEISSKRIISKYHNIDLGVIGHFTFDLFFKYKLISTVIGMTGDCFHSVDQLCQPWIQELYDVDKNGSGAQNTRCHCLRFIYRPKSESDRYFQDCDGRNVTDPDSAVSFNFFLGFISFVSFRDEYTPPGAARNAGIRIRVNPVVCYTDFIPPPPDILCGNGITASNETRCLYRISEFGTMIGCRSLVHLQNCESFSCPGGFFKCSESFCLENRFVCDGEKQCRAGEDEQNCGTQLQTCVSQYRCLHTDVCLSLKYLCDGIRHCPLGDDERFCNFRCTQGCTCKGMAADCRLASVDSDNTTLSNDTRSIDISTNPAFFTFFTRHLNSLIYLSFLNMSACMVSEISSDTFQSLENLLVLDMSFNFIRVFSSKLFANQHRLKELLLTGNTEVHVIETNAFIGLHSLSHLEITHARIGQVLNDAFQSLTLKSLDITDSTIDHIENEAFKGCTAVNVILTGTVIKSFDKGMFQDFNITDTLVTDSYMFCCIRPFDLPEENCYPHKNEFSSCSDLMRHDALRILLWVIGTCSLLGNAASLVYRFVFDRERLKLGYGIFVSNLAVADFLMGIYLITIAAADAAFRGTYIFNDESWRTSAWCNMAGVLSAMSSEASVLFICLITVDRILVVKYPFGQIRFTMVPSIACSCIVWVVVTLIAILPILISSYFQDVFYSKTGVCLALPLTRDRPPGWGYSVGIFIGFNFVTFLFIAAGQWLIYRAIHNSRMKMRSVSTARSKDLRVARNLLLVATTDFLCWFPVGIVGFMAMTNYVIPGEVYAWTAVLVLPINSALNPFLYTLSAIVGKGKFSPDRDEQARPEVIPIDVFDRLSAVWNNKMFIQPSYAKQLLPLIESLGNKGFKPQKCLLTAVTVAKCLAMLHERDICHSNLIIQDLYKKPSKAGSFTVALSLDPKLVTKEDEKHEEISRFGNIVNALLKACSDMSATPGTSGTSKL